MREINNEIKAEIDSLPDFHSNIPMTSNICMRCHEVKPKKEFSITKTKRKICLSCCAIEDRFRKRKLRKEKTQTGFYDSIGIFWDPRLTDEVKEKEKIRRKARKAVLSGKLVKPDSCSLCGCSTKKIQAHHDDYGNPLDVIWVCTTCHAREFHMATDKGGK